MPCFLEMFDGMVITAATIILSTATTNVSCKRDTSICFHSLYIWNSDQYLQVFEFSRVRGISTLSLKGHVNALFLKYLPSRENEA